MSTATLPRKVRMPCSGSVKGRPCKMDGWPAGECRFHPAAAAGPRNWTPGGTRVWNPPPPPRAPRRFPRPPQSVLNVVAVLAALIFLVSLWPESKPPPPAPQSPVSALQRWESPHGLGSAYYQAVLDALNQITADMEAPGRKEYLDLVPPSDGANLIDAVTGAQEDPPPVAAAIYMSALDQLAAAGHDLERRQYHSARRALGAGYRNLGTFARDIQQ